MGQIVSSAAKPKRCNLNQLSQLGTPAAGEYILVSSDNSMNAAGQGNFDCYIEGDGQKAATALELKSLADDVPTSGSKNAVSSGGMYDSIEGKEETTLMLTAGRGLNPNGTIYVNTAASITDYISVNEGEKVNFYGAGANTYGAIAGYNASKTFVANLLTHNGQILNTSVTIPSGIAYIRCAARNHTYSASTPDPSASLITFDPILRASGKYISYNAQSFNDNDKAQARNNLGLAGIGEKVTENTKKVDSVLNAFSVTSVTLDWPLDKIIYPGGQFIGNSNFKCTDYVKVNPNDVVMLKAKTGETQYPVCMGYDKNKHNPVVLLNGGDHNDDYNLITIPDGVEYIACSSRANETHDAYIETYHLKELSDPIGTVVIEKENSTTMWVSVRMSETDYIRYKFIHYNKVFSEIEYLDGDGNTQVATNVTSCSVWNNIEVYKNTSYIAQGNTNFINKPTGGVYSGDGHGLEVALYEKIFLDGVEVDFDNLTEPIKGRQFRLLLKSNIYKHGSGDGDVYTNVPLLDTSGNPIVSTIHNMDVIVEDGEMNIDNYLVMAQDNISFQECFGAMLECRYTDFDTVFANNSDMSINSQSGGVFTNVSSTISLPGTYQHCDKIIMKGSGFTITQDMINVEPTDCKAGVFFEAYSNRLKCYFQPVPTSVRSGGQTARVFNTGDVIHVKCHRRIEC